MGILNKIFKSNRLKKISQFFLVPNSSILEIGVHKGDFSLQILKKFKPQRLILVDPWIYKLDEIYKSSLYGGSIQEEKGQLIQNQYYQNLKNTLKNEIQIGKVEIIRKKSSEAFKQLKEKFDMIYIDGNHLYDFVLEDLTNSLEKINNNGLIVCDDYKHKGWWNDGVTKAIDNLEKNKKIKIIHEHNFFNRHHQCIIKKILQ